ncbi:dihydrofolate reductase [Aldersonia kunmingensis]|uniref:dihydrofolate reductase n=1 Tax=Aldersonia kunmingensis TaxID=408066 RepID=UPI00083685E0|nr:dihydrofolate reductase [Aldersonia kunmingensis]
MSSTPVRLVWAQTPTGVIGSGNDIPWHLPEDLAHFKRVTMGSAVVMGRKTWDSLPERNRPLPGRRNIVVTRQADWYGYGAEPAPSVRAAIALVLPDPVAVIGGAQIYDAALPAATELVVTEVDLDVSGDAFAPAIGPEWTIAEDGEWQRSKAAGTAFRIRRYVRSNAR